MDDWLHRYAGQNRRNNTAAARVLADQRPSGRHLRRVVDDCDRPHRRTGFGCARLPDPVPALLAGRLVVDEGFAGLGVGTAMVRHLLATAVEVHLSAARKAVMVTALHEQARAWWLKLTPAATAARLGITQRALAALRRRGAGPSYIRLSGATIRYLNDDLNAAAGIDTADLSPDECALGRRSARSHVRPASAPGAQGTG